MDKFYLQDSRDYVGNDVLWWKKGGAGYTTDLSKAEVFSKDAAVRQHECRESDIPWPKDYIDGKTRPAVDFQYINRKDALTGTGIVLRKPSKPRKEIYRCNSCGIFMTINAYYGGPCDKCGTNNQP